MFKVFKGTSPPFVVYLSLYLPIVYQAFKPLYFNLEAGNLSGLFSKLSSIVYGFVLKTLVFLSQSTAFVA
jgi:hypothetical protein